MSSTHPSTATTTTTNSWRGPALLGVGLALLLGAGVASGLWSGRWGASPSVEAAAARLDQIPMTIGDWEGEAREVSVEDYRRFDFAGMASRQYVNRRTGDQVTLSLVTGPPGPICVHTPEICYPGVGYEIVADRAPRSLELGSGEPARFWDLRVGKPSQGSAEALSIYYAWSADGAWRAPEGEPRLVYGAEPYLYKMYVIQGVESADAPAPANEEFLQALIPVLRESLFEVDGKDATGRAAPEDAG